MKATYLVSLTMSCAMLMQGTSYAVPSQPASAVSSTNLRHLSDKNGPRSRATLTAASRPQQLPNSRKRSVARNATNSHQPSSGKSGRAATGGSIQNETVNSAPSVRRPNAIRPTMLSFNTVRHRGPNPAVVGGTANPACRNTGTINGTRMNRKP